MTRTSTWEWAIDADEVRWAGDPDATTAGPPAGFRGTLPAFLDLLHPDDRSSTRDTLARAARDGSRFATEFRIVRSDGSVRWRAIAGDVVRSRTERPVRLVAAAQDVTELKATNERLAQAAGRYRTLVEQLPLASYVEGLDEESAAYISPQIVDLVGYTAEQWVADPDFFASTLHPADRDRVLADFAAMHKTGESFECEYRLVARDGRVVWIHDAAVVVRDGAGEPMYAQGYMIDISDRKRNEQALRRSQQRLQEQMVAAEYQALHDELTGLPNRTLFHDRVEQALRQGRRDGSTFGVMLIDLDRFKDVNDTLGHQSGDLLLQEIAARLRGAMRANDTVARLGGDEFAVLAAGPADVDGARQFADRLREDLAKPISIGGVSIEMEASVGIALYPPDGDDPQTLLRRADVSMYVSKSSHVPVVYTAALDHHSVARLGLVSELRRALDSDELIVYYQPQAYLGTGIVQKVEALVRWQHPDRGLLGPDQFIPLAEQTGLIRALTRFVLDAALGQCRAWLDAGRDIRVAVNITGRELLDLAFPDEVVELLAKWDLEPGRLELEITETTIMTDPPRARAILGRLRDLGVRLAVDDFGSGNSSLSYLKRLPIDVLKIDKSFVQNMAVDAGDAAIVRTAIDLGRSLGLEVVAEGVETEDAKRHLAALGCDAFQGYYLGRPQPADAVFGDTAHVGDGTLTCPKSTDGGAELAGRTPRITRYPAASEPAA
jgi:diguanylate cyclase (GGDEF)-like protein/PAS domain S-box-containing protein